MDTPFHGSIERCFADLIYRFPGDVALLTVAKFLQLTDQELVALKDGSFMLRSRNHRLRAAVLLTLVGYTLTEFEQGAYVPKPYGNETTRMKLCTAAVAIVLGIVSIEDAAVRLYYHVPRLYDILLGKPLIPTWHRAYLDKLCAQYGAAAGRLADIERQRLRVIFPLERSDKPWTY